MNLTSVWLSASILTLLPSAPLLAQERLPGEGAPQKAESGNPGRTRELGGRRPPSRPFDPTAERSLAPYRCLRCDPPLPTEPAQRVPDRLLGGAMPAVQTWLKGMKGEDPIVLISPRWSLVLVLSQRSRGSISIDDERFLRRGLPSVSTGKGQLDPHQAAHLWAERLVTLESELAEVFDLTLSFEVRPIGRSSPPLAHPRSEIVVLSDAGDLAAFSAQILPAGQRPIVGTVGPEGPIAAVLVDGHGEADHARFSFAATRALVRRLWRLGSGVPEWLQEGLAHEFARRALGPPSRTSPGKEATLPEKQESPGDWDLFIRDTIVGGKSAHWDSMSALPETGMGLRVRLQAWSTVEYLLGQDRNQGALFWRHLLCAEPGESSAHILKNALRDAFKTDVVTMEARWKAWALVKKD